MPHDTSTFSEAQTRASGDAALALAKDAGERAEDLVQTWVKAGNAAAVLEVAERGNGSARKAARRGLNVLKSRGVPIPTRPHVASLSTAVPHEFQALMLPADPSGVTLFIISARTKTGHSKACFVFLRDDQGIVRIESGELSQSRIREQLRRISPDSDYDAVSVPLDWARARIAAARRTHSANGLIEPLGFATAADLLLPLSEPTPAHPFDEEGFEFSDEDARSLTAGSARLHRLPEFRGWFPGGPAIEEMLQRLATRFPDEGTPESEVVSTWVKEEVVAATDRYFTPERREALLFRLKDAALSVLSRDGESAALEVAALIQVIGKAGLITDPPSDIPFLRAYFEKAVGVLAAQNGGRLRIPVSGSAAAHAAP